LLWNRFGPLFTNDIRCGRASRSLGFRRCQRYLDVVRVKLSSEMVYVWRGVDHGGEALAGFVDRSRH
jgi:hypothetical protein